MSKRAQAAELLLEAAALLEGTPEALLASTLARAVRVRLHLDDATIHVQLPGIAPPRVRVTAQEGQTVRLVHTETGESRAVSLSRFCEAGSADRAWEVSE